MGISKYRQNAARQYQTLFYFIVSHHMQYFKSRNAVHEIIFNKIRLYCNRFPTGVLAQSQDINSGRVGVVS